MTIKQFFKQKELENTMLIGYYGGGNYGDELLLEVILNLMYNKGVKSLKYYYCNDNFLQLFHSNFPYKAVNPQNKLKFLGSLFTSKNIIIGGGGIWGLDFNRNIFILSVLLFILRYFCFKNVYLIGIGYYSSTTRLGHISAYLAGKASNDIIARDKESFDRFSAINHNTFQDYDISFNIEEIDEKRYIKDVTEIAKILKIENKKKYLLILLRRFNIKHKNNYKDHIETIINTNTDKNILFGLLEPKEMDSQGYETVENIAKNHKNVTTFDYHFNPISFYFFLKANQSNIITIAPQFHAIIVSYLAQIKYFPLVYDNKTAELFKLIDQKEPFDIKDITVQDIQKFIDKNY